MRSNFLSFFMRWKFLIIDSISWLRHFSWDRNCLLMLFRVSISWSKCQPPDQYYWTNLTSWTNTISTSWLKIRSPEKVEFWSHEIQPPNPHSFWMLVNFAKSIWFLIWIWFGIWFVQLPFVSLKIISKLKCDGFMK
jgi:hypothetical protein